MKKFLSASLLFCLNIIFLFSLNANQLATGSFREIARESRKAVKENDNQLQFFSGSVKMEIGKDGIDTDLDISAAKVDFSYHSPRFRRKGNLYSFSPDGLKFNKPILLTLPYDDDGTFVEENIEIFYFNESSGKWEAMPKVSQDVEKNTITAWINHFSSYTPGLGSYSVNEGMSPNSIYFRNNNEQVDPASGTLFINRADLDFPGRGIDLVLESQFSSDRYYYNYKSSNTAWDFDSEFESKHIYKFANGWRWKLPALRCKTTYDLFGNANGRTFYYYTPEGKRYDLPVTLVKNKAVGEIVTADGCRVYKTANVVDNGNSSPDYNVAIELIEEKVVLSGDVLDVTSSSVRFNPWIFFPDGRIFKVYSITGGLKYSGNIKTIQDAAQKNTITFTYNAGTGSISTITDTVGRDFIFNYTSADRLESITYGDPERGIANRIYNRYTITSSSPSNQLTAFRQLVRTVNNVDEYLTTAYDYTIPSTMKITITYPSGGISEYNFGNLYNSGTTETVSPPGGNTIYINTYKYRPVVKSQSIKESSAAAPKTITYDYLGAKTYAPQNSDKQYIMGYYSLLKENNFVETTTQAWRPWLNCRIKYYTQTYDNSGNPVYSLVDNGTTITTSPSSLGQSEYCPMRSEIADTLKKTAACYRFESGVFQGVEKEITYIKNNSWVIDKMTVNEFSKINTYSDYYQASKSSYYFNPTDDLNPGTKQYGESTEYDSFGRALTAIDPEGNVTEYGYVYPSFMDNGGLDGTLYQRKLNKFGLTYKVIRKQDDAIQPGVDQENFFYYDDMTRNLIALKKRKQTYDAVTKEWVYTKFDYDTVTNTLTAITDAKENVISLEYDATYSAFITRDIRVISPAIALDNGITATGMVNEFGYDDLGRLLTKRTAYTDAAGNSIPGYTSETSSYKYDDLGRVTEVTTGVALKKYVYDDSANTLTAYSLVESLGGNSYLAVKGFQQYDGLDRKTAEETTRLNITLSSGNAITEQPGAVLTSKKAYEYHPVFINTVAKTTVYEDATTAAQITETSFDAYARPLEIKANEATILKQYIYDDTLNQTMEKSFRDTTNYTMKGIQKDWIGNTRWVFDWLATTGTRGLDNAQATEFCFDAFGNKIWVKIPPYSRAGSGNGEEFNYYYNSFGQVEKTEYYKGTVASLTEESKYDNNGNLVEFKDRTGNKTICEYNTLNQMTVKRTYKLVDSVLPLEETTEFQYSQFETPIRIVKKDANGQWQSEYHYMYNNLGQLTKFEQFVGSETNYKHYSITNTYDRGGNLDTTKLWDGEPGVTLIKALDYDIASIGNESAVYELTETGKGDLLAKVKTKLWGGIETIEYGPAPVMKTDYTYNSLLQPTNITNSGRMALSYDYDLQGNVTRWTNETMKTFTYDGLDQLLTETAGTITDRYFYDAIGNRTAIDKGNDSISDVMYTFDPIKKMQLNNYTGNGKTWIFDYDANGNTTSKTDNTTSWSYSYNSSNQLIEVKKDGNTIGRYEYDSNGLRIKKIESGTTTYYIYNGQSILFEETFSSADNLEKREYNIELGGMNLAKYRWDAVNSWQLNYHFNDHLGSRQVVSNATGTVLNTTSYGTFGEYKNGSEEEYKYTGKQRDNSTGLVYYNARYYDTELGRFITLDPAKQGNSWYVYCGNNPLRYIDTNGQQYTEAVAAGLCWLPFVDSPIIPIADIVYGAIVGVTAFCEYALPILNTYGQYLPTVIEKGNAIVNNLGNAMNNLPDPKDLGKKIKQIFEKIKNNIQDHLTQKDIEGCIKETNGQITKLKINGVPYNHIKEVSDALDGLRKNMEKIQNFLDTFTLSENMKEVLIQTLSEVSKYTDSVEKIIQDATK